MPLEIGRADLVRERLYLCRVQRMIPFFHAKSARAAAMTWWRSRDYALTTALVVLGSVVASGASAAALLNSVCRGRGAVMISRTGQHPAGPTPLKLCR